MSCDKCGKKIEMVWVLMLTPFSYRNKHYQSGNKYKVEKFIADYLTFNKCLIFLFFLFFFENN